MLVKSNCIYKFTKFYETILFTYKEAHIYISILSCIEFSKTIPNVGNLYFPLPSLIVWYQPFVLFLLEAHSIA